MRINELEPRIYNKISAGEVVERPASIVKEVVENSIDAGATEITIKIEGGGIKSISVSDNGCGIHFDDLRRAFLPHATSKIKDAEDLNGIKTLGFRGEALASIGAVSEVTLISKEKEAAEAGIIEISGGTIVTQPTITSGADGTTITVSNLFFNVPARAKFLKKPKTEELEITNLVSRFILANPFVAIKYIVDGKVKYISTGRGMEDALFVIYGKDALDGSVYIEKDYGYIKVYGYIGKPSFSKPNRTYQTIIINNRVITNQTISQAVLNAYGELLMKKQFPFFVLYLDLDYTKVDVNVHPNKLEVRFENNSDIYYKVFELVNRKINALDYTNNIKFNFKTEEKKEEKTFVYREPETEQVEISPSVEVLIEEQPNNNESIAISAEFSCSSLKSEKDFSEELEFEPVSDEEAKETRNIFEAMTILGDNKTEFQDGVKVGSKLLEEMQRKYARKRAEEEKKIESQIRILGVLFKTYIVAEFNENMILVDQHAGHERILYDDFMERLLIDKLDLQPLMVPYVFNLNPQEEEMFDSIIPNLNELGFEVERFGERDYRVNTVPYLLTDINFDDFFASVFSELKTYKKIGIRDMIRDKIATLACKAAVKAGDYLAKEEVEKLIKDFAKLGTKLLCPHGRPIVVQIEKKELEKWFKRIV